VNRARFALLLPVVAVLAACGGPQIPPSQNYPTIRGRAFDSATNQPVAGVGVTVSTILTATTGADGTYRIPNVPIGSYTLIVSPPRGYTAPPQPQYNGSVASGETAVIDIPLTHT
jgi:hypothetical protein